ncbi:MAG TPA: DMT family transporter [Quisquiliibacterium sp.]|nr:DMT family transporter [Quisquiliibacterium sp.]
MSSPALLPVAALLLNAFVWGVSWLPFRLLDARGLHSLWATVWIYAFAGLVVLARHPGAAGQVLRNPWLALLALASGVTNACFNWGVTVGEVVRVVLLFYLMPVWAVLLARALLGDRITGGALARVALAVAGAAVVLWRPGAGLPLPAGLGDWLGLAGGAAFALTNVLLRRQAEDPAQARAFAMFAGGVAVPAMLAASIAAVPAPAVDGGVALLATLTGVLFLAANLALQYGAARLPTAVTAVVMLSEVVFAAATAVMFGDETLSARTLAGGAMIVGASLLAALEARKLTG